MEQSGDLTAIAHHTEWSGMRDGVLLASEVYLPDDLGPHPVVLMRSPYNGAFPEGLDAVLPLVAHGYAIVNQDCRGTARSHGVLRPFQQEQSDGYDAVEWAGTQPWSNGKVGLWGGSYLGVTALQAAVTHPPHLEAVIAAITASDYHDNWTYANGVFDLWFALNWVSLWADEDTVRRQLLKADVTWTVVEQQVKGREARSIQNLPEWLKVTPLAAFADFKPTASFYYEWLSHPFYDRYWSAIDVERRYADVSVPILFVGGWYDIFSVGTVRNFLGVRANGHTVGARKQTKLVMAPVCHGTCNETLKFTTDTPSLLALFGGDTRWWDYWLKGVDTGITDDPAVRLFVMMLPETGDKDTGFWATADQYPLPDTKRVRFYLTSHGHANTRRGDGDLRRQVPRASEPDRFVYDPQNPVPTRGGNLAGVDLFKPGIFDQSDVELRNDVLVYTGDPLTTDLSIIGPVAVDFWAASSAADTDFTAKFVAVRSDGLAYNILDRIVDAALRRSSKLPPEPIVPGRVYRFHIDLGHTALVLKKGFRLRLELSSSNFPHFARNSNTGQVDAGEGKFRRARQIVKHDSTHPSYLELPVVENLQQLTSIASQSAGQTAPSEPCNAPLEPQT